MLLPWIHLLSVIKCQRSLWSVQSFVINSENVLPTLKCQELKQLCFQSSIYVDANGERCRVFRGELLHCVIYSFDLKQNSRILVHIDKIASRCRFVGCTSMTPVSPHHKGALLDWDLVAVGVQWTHCHVPETGLRGYNVCDMVGSATKLITTKHYTTSLDPCFHCLYTKFWPHLNIAAEIETHQTRKCFSNLLLSNFVGLCKL